MCDEFALNLDLAPTLLELAGVTAPNTMQGRSLAPLLKGKRAAWRSSFLLEYYSDKVFPRMTQMGYQAARQFKGAWDGALSNYNQALTPNPRFHDAWFNQGALWKLKGEWARAEADFTAALALQPQWASTYAPRGLLRLLQNRAAEAQPDFDRCLELNPDLRQSVERLIAEAKQHLAGRGPSQ